MPRRPVKNRLADLRKRGVVLSQEQIGLLLGWDGATVSRHENGKRRMTDDDVQKYARLYQVATHEIYFGPEPALATA